MTTPGGVPNLPQGALTLDNIASKTQDMTPAGMRGRTNERVSSIFGASTGGDITSDFSPFGIIAAIFAGFSSVVANADPADITGPEDLPGLLIDFIESLPFIGQFVELFEAILGSYTGDDETLLGIQALFAPIRALVGLVPGLFGGTSIDDLSSMAPSDVWGHIFSLFMDPLGILAGLGGGGALADGQKPNIVQQILDAGKDVFSTGTQGASTGSSITDFFGGFLGVHRTGTGAVAVNNVQDAQISALLSGGSGLSYTFDGASASTLPSSDWHQTGFGSGAGTLGLSGTGTAKWNTSGINPYGIRNRYLLATLTTDIQKISLTIVANLGVSTIGNNPEIRLQGRMNTAETDYVEARVTCNSAEIGYVVSGTYTRIGATQSVSGNTSGTWDLKLGTVSSTREFVLLLNGVTVMSRTDVGAASQMNGTHVSGGFSALAGETWFGGLLFFQLAPPEIDSWAASDRLAGL